MQNFSTTSCFTTLRRLVIWTGLILTIISISLLCSVRYAFPATQPKISSTKISGTHDPVSLYLTFDDGIIDASKVLDSLARLGEVPINVFLIGKFVYKSDSSIRLWQQIQKNSWIEAGNHSFSHANGHYHKYYQDITTAFRDFEINQDTLHLTRKQARLPGRNAWRIKDRTRDDLEDCKAIADSLSVAGYTLFGWDIEWHYNASTLALEPADDLLFRIGQLLHYQRSFTPRHIIILCHDPALNNTASIIQLLSFIEKARNCYHYQFKFLSQYPAF